MPKEPRRRRQTASTEEGRENQLVSLAIDLAERQLEDGTATSQVIAHYLKAGSLREKLERERLENENELLKVKVQHMASAQRVEELYSEALDAMRAYAGQITEASEMEEDAYDD